MDINVEIKASDIIEEFKDEKIEDIILEIIKRLIFLTKIAGVEEKSLMKNLTKAIKKTDTRIQNDR